MSGEMTAFENDTIAAIATGPGESGISIVRIAGPRSLEVADLIFRCHGARPSGRAGGSFVHGYVTGNASADGRTEDIDEAILLIYRAPHSYTRENVVEIQGHGGTLSAKRILRRVLDCGVRSAEPGEFTKRAFLSGRIDLLQAEAVLDLIRARSDRAANAALEQLSGRLSASIVSIYDELLLIASDIEVSLDFSDDETSPISLASICRQLEVADGHLGELLSTWDEGHMLRDGVLTVISGRPNVGKSTLFNAMLGIDRAIVTEHPGTTRDTIEETLVLDGIPLRLVDTAGLRDTECDIEKEGIQRARYHIGKADFHVHVLDGSRPLDTADQEHIREMDPKNTILVMNKSDLGIQMNPQNMGDFAVIHTSLVSGEGVDKLKRTIAQRLQRYSSTPHAVISERHRQAMTLSRQYLSEATSLLMTNRDDTVVLAVSAVRRALETIGAINGRTYHDELLNQVFSRFCVGK